MSLWWWTCTACAYRTRCHHSLTTAERDRDDHISWTHPGRRWEPYQISISTYRFLEVHP